MEKAGFGTLSVDLQARGLNCRESFLSLAGDALDTFLIDAAERLRPGRRPRRSLPPWAALTDRVKLAVYGGGHGLELHLELFPDRDPGYWTVETSLRASPESVGRLGAELRRAFDQSPGRREPPRLPAVGIHAVTASEALALATEAQRLNWPVFRIEGPATEKELLRALLSTFPLDPPGHSNSDIPINWDSLSDSLWGGIDGQQRDPQQRSAERGRARSASSVADRGELLR